MQDGERRLENQMEKCLDCPRRCGMDRTERLGACRAPAGFLVARIAPHMWEEPCISGVRGSGTVFFGGCSLGCVFCQNRAIRDGELGELLAPDALLERVEALVEGGVHNVNLVTPTHYTRALVPFLERLRARVSVPIVWNSSGYESVDMLRLLDGLVDVYLPDFKYATPEMAAYSHAPDYPEVASSALVEMLRQRGPVRFDADGMLESGVLIRHLVLPGGRRDSAAVIRKIAELVPVPDVRLSLMSQYTPDFVDSNRYPALARRVTTFEYQSVLDLALDLGFEGYFQSRASATAAFTPDFDGNGACGC